ncbi:hypothetical protein ACIP2Y_44370 [Streptomyces sviceus]|uniref:hypothetical protein n=1 Tax=Streptomyces sviceus TaxID=285530 RepID=UPI003825CB49
MQSDERQQTLAVAAQFDWLGVILEPELAEQAQKRGGRHFDRLARHGPGSLLKALAINFSRCDQTMQLMHQHVGQSVNR